MTEETGTKSALQQERRIQEQIDSREKKDGRQGGEEKSPMQAGARDYPDRFPQQHLRKPGEEADLELRPMFEAPHYKGSEKLQGKVAIITGGDSGIGRAVAVLFAREGADVTIAYLSEHGDAETTAKAIEAEGRRCHRIAGDVADPSFCRKVVDETVKTFGRLDILVNNAAFQEHASSLDEISDEHFDRTMKTNLYGYFNMVKAAVPHMAPKGAIIMTGSVTAIEGSKELLDYSITKGGIHTFVRSLSAQLIDKDIKVNCVAPGPVWTPLNPADKAAEKVAEFGRQTAMRRAAQPEEIAPAYVFLAAPTCSSYITGEVLPIIGGYS